MNLKEANPILSEVIDSRNGHYCHCVEVSEVCELENIADTILEEHEDKHGKAVVLDFLLSLQVYCLEDDNEDEIYDFSFSDYLA